MRRIVVRFNSGRACRRFADLFSRAIREQVPGIRWDLIENGTQVRFETQLFPSEALNLLAFLLAAQDGPVEFSASIERQP